MSSTCENIWGKAGTANDTARLEDVADNLGVKGPVARIVEYEYGGYRRTGEVYFLLDCTSHSYGCE